MIDWKKGYDESQTRRKSNEQASVIIKKGADEEVVDFVSPYTIKNQTGYEIQLERDFGNTFASLTRKSSISNDQIYKVKHREFTQYLVESDMKKLFQQGLDHSHTSNKIIIRFNHPVYEIQPLHGVDIDRPKLTEYPLFGAPKGQYNFTKLNFSVFVEVSIVHGKKFITVSSGVKFTNKMNAPYDLNISYGKNEYHTVLQPNESQSIPFDAMKGSFQIKAQNSEKYSQLQPLLPYLQHDDKITELDCDQNFLFARSIRPVKSLEYAEICFEPPFFIKNCCPVNVSYQIYIGTSQDPNIRNLKPQECYSEYQASRVQNVSIKLRIPGFLWSEKFLIYSIDSKVKTAKELILKDIKGNKLTLYLFSSENSKGSKSFYLYSKMMIINETPYNLSYFAVDEKDKKKTPIAGQTPTDPTEKYNKKIMLLDEAKMISIARKQEKESSDTIVIAGVGNTFASLVSENEKSMLELGINMSISSCDRENYLYTKVITISPRYVVINKTNYLMGIKKDRSSAKPIILEKDVRTPFYWSEWDKKE